MTKSYQLRAVRIVKSRSRETTCFTGTLYANEKKIADLDNDGGGGPNIVFPVKGCEADVAAFYEWCRGLPGHVAPWDPTKSISMDSDFWISLRVQEREREQDVNRLLSTRILYESAGKVLQSKVLKSLERERLLAAPLPAGCRVLTDAQEVMRLLYPAD